MSIYNNKIFFLTLLLSVMVSCSSGDDIIPNTPDIELQDGGYITKCDFRDGDNVSRSSFVFDNNFIRFAFNQGDITGIYPTFNLTKQEKTDYAQQEQSAFVLAASGSGFIHIDPEGNPDGFTWADGFKRTAYFPYDGSFNPNNKTHPVCYNALPFSFKNQVQEGYVNLTAYYNGDSRGDKGNDNPTYRESEEKACAHLNSCNFLISPESEFNVNTGRIRFYAHPIGAVARFYLLAPKEKMQLMSLRLVASKPIFYEEGTVDLTSNPYNGNAEDKNDGLKLVSSVYTKDKDRQMHPVGDPVSSIELKFADNVWTNYDATTMPYGHYMIAYLMMYPVNLTEVSELYVYLTAKDKDGKVKNYRTNNLEKKDLFSGNYYQWMYKALDDEHPIELTATEIPWQDVVGGSINLGEEE